MKLRLRLRFRLGIVRKMIFNHVLIIYLRRWWMYLDVAILHKDHRLPEKFIRYIIFILSYIWRFNILTVFSLWRIGVTLYLLDFIVIARVYTYYCVFTTFICNLIIYGLVDVMIIFLICNSVVIRLSFIINLTGYLIFIR